MMPTTGFEDRVANDEFPDWTTIEEEADYLAALQTYAPGKLDIRIVGKSVQGNPIRLIKMGSGGPRVLIVAQQHGWEVAGREAVLILMRELATTTDPDVIEHLARTTWLFMPTINPDRLGVSRENANGVDLNRTHMSLSQPETRAIHRVISAYRPHIIVDAHEARDASRTLEYLWTMNPNTDPTLVSTSRELCEDWIAAKVASEGYSVGQYNVTREPDRLLLYGGLAGSIAVLLETKRSNTPNEYPRATRVEVQLICMREILRFHIQEFDRVNFEVTRARANQVARSRTGQVYGYWLTDEQVETVEERLRLHGININEYKGMPFVTMAQEVRPLVEYALDPASSYRLVSGTRVTDRPPTSALLRKDEGWFESITKVRSRQGWTQV